MSLFQVSMFENGRLIDFLFVNTFFEAVGAKIAHTTADPVESNAVIEELTCTACGGGNLTVGQGDGTYDAIIECADCDNCMYVAGPESTFNEDWLNWPDAPGGDSYADGCDPGCAVHKCSAYECSCASERMDAWAAQIKYENACMGLTPEGKDYEPFGEDVDFAQAQMVRECAEASWYRFCAR